MLNLAPTKPPVVLEFGEGIDSRLLVAFLLFCIPMRLGILALQRGRTSKFLWYCRPNTE
jgi:hypothetical protein